MKPRREKAYILYCSNFRSHRTHRELVNCATELGWMINAVPWEDSANGAYTGSLTVDGAISHLPARFTKLLHRKIGDVPHVTLNAQTLTELKLPGVASNHMAAGRLVARHFIDLGFTSFAAVSDHETHPTFDARLAGFADVIHAGGLTSPKRVVLPESARGNQMDMLTFYGAVLKSMPLPVAIMAANDRVAVKLMHACWQEDLSIPAQVAICGFDNDPVMCELAPIPLSSVDTDPETQAREAIRLMAELRKGVPPPQPPRHVEPRGLVVRRSSGVRAHKGATVAKALAHIHEHALFPDVSIPRIAEHVGVSCTTLFAAFRRELRQTPLEYITALRISEAQRLLKETDLKVKQVRQRCGFASDYQMYQAFKRTTGRSPGSCRT